MLEIEKLPALYWNYRARYTERDERFDTIHRVITGENVVEDAGDDELEKRSPNLIQVALEDTAEAASVLPTLRVVPSKLNDQGKRQASKMEKIGAGYLSVSSPELFLVQFFLDVAGYGLSASVVWPDLDEQRPVIERRDPRTCYPEPGWRPHQAVRRCMFARDVYFSQLPLHYQVKLQELVNDQMHNDPAGHNVVVTLVEVFDEEEYVLAGLFQTVRSHIGSGRGQADMLTPVLLERIENKLGVCPVVLGQRRTFDGEARGQFDQVVGAQKAHQRLWGLMLDYADQAVYSDVWVKDLVGELAYGGGGFIELGPNGAIGRVPPAVTGMTAQQDLGHLEEVIHLGGRWPKSRPGDIDQSIASAKFVEATAGMMNTAIRTHHMVAKDVLERLLRICFLTDQKFFPGVKVCEGILRNQEFVEEYDTDDINVDHSIRIEYGLGLGRDPAQSAVLMLQYAQAGYISKEFVQENIDGLADVERERIRLDVERLQDMAYAKLLQGLEGGTIPESALIDLAQARQAGDDIFDLYRKYIVAPKEEAANQLLPSGLPGAEAGLMPGPLGPDGMPAGPPPGVSVPGGPPALSPPPAPEPTEMLARLGTQAGPGSFIGAEVRT